MSINELFTPEQLEALQSGETISGSLKDGIVEAKVFTPSTTTPISGYGSNIRAVIRDESGEPIKAEMVTRPNIDRHNKAAAARALKDLEIAEKAKEEESQLSPTNLLSTVKVLERKVRKLEKLVKEQQS